MKNPKEPNVIVEFVSSSNITSAEYDPFMEALTIFFKSGAQYDYIGVPMKLFEDFRAASSAGKFFHLNIRNKFDVMKRG